MTVLASAVLSRVRTQLIDDQSVQRWTTDELLRWLSDGQRTIVAAQPAASARTVTHTLIAGTRQTAPDDAYAALELIRNTSGRACTPVERVMLDTQYPDWHIQTPTDLVRHFFVDPYDRRAFYVYPPNTGAGSVELTYAPLPPELAAETDEIAVDDAYQVALVDYVMYRAHQKDADFAAGQALAGVYLNAFTAFLTAAGG